MKKLTVLICLLFCGSSGLFAQYQSIFGNLQTSWNVLNEAAPGYATDSLVMGSDTTLNLKVYKQVLFYHLDHSSPAPPVLETKAYLREDVSTGKAWIYYGDANPENLFMDLSLNVGDTFPVNNMNYAIDSVYQKDGRKHVRSVFGYVIPLDYSVSCGALTFIEGIGTTYGFTYDYQGTGIGFPPYHQEPFLLCSWKDNTHVYTHENPNPFFNDCYKSGTVESTHNNTDGVAESITIVPNPASDNILISTRDKEKIEKIMILDYLGRTEFSFDAKSSGGNHINVGSFPDGVYFVRILLQDNTELSSKLIIHH